MIKNSFRKGFSFVEVMISVFLVSVGLLAALSLLTTGLRETMGSRDQVIASMLAQEGVELVRAMRDKNWAEGNPYNGGIILLGNKIIDYNSPLSVPSVAFNPSSFKLFINSEGFYEHGSGTPTKFSRKINIYTTTDYITVESLVTWSNSFDFTLNSLNCNLKNKCAYSRTILSDWGK